MRQRRQFSAEFKARVVLEVLSGQKRAAEVCRGLSRVSAQARSAQSVEGRLCDPSGERVCGRRTQPTRRAAHCRAGATGGTADIGTRGGKKSCAALSREQRWQMSAQLRPAYPLAVICDVLALPRSSAYARATCDRMGDRDDVEEEQVRTHIERIAGQWPTYGYRRVTAQLRREGTAVNGKRIRRLMHELGLVGSAPKWRCRTTNSDHPYPRYPNLVADLAIKEPDAVWVADITYMRLRQEFVYLAVLMDVYTRAIRGWEFSRHLDQALTLAALERALATGHQPGIHHSDQGVQYAATAYVARLQQCGAQISMAEQGEPRQNGHAERLMRTIKEEEVALTEYRDFADAYAQIGRFLDEVYQRKRIHSALGYLTPAEFEAAFHARPPGSVVIP